MRSVRSDVPKEAMAIFGNLNIHEPIEHNFIGYLGGIDDGWLDTVQGAERANVTTFIDFTISKTWLYSSRSERSAKARMYRGTLFSVCRIVRRWICTMFSLRMRSHSCCMSYGFTKLASLHHSRNWYVTYTCSAYKVPRDLVYAKTLHHDKIERMMERCQEVCLRARRRYNVCVHFVCVFTDLCVRSASEYCLIISLDSFWPWRFLN